MKNYIESNTFFADFETTKNKDNTLTRVYLWVILNKNETYHGNSIESFFNFIKDKEIMIYFHNLKFDFSFLEHYLLSNNIDYSILEKKNSIYSVKLYGCIILDTLNFLPITLKEIGENYCENLRKTQIDYDVDYDHNFTNEELDYCINDCLVLMEGFNAYISSLKNVLESVSAFNTLEKVDKKLTNAGIAFECFKELSDFEKLCPKTTIKEYNIFIKAYKGGYVFSRPNGVVKNVKMIDCNSMYPFVYSNKEMPFGHFKKCQTLNDCYNFNFFIINISIKFELKLGFIPIIGGGFGKYSNVKYLESSDGIYNNITVCNKDFELIKEFYDIDYEFNWGVGFETKANFFKKYCDTFLKVKNENKGIKRNVAKVMLNSPYGKCAMNGLNDKKRYFLNEENVVKNEVTGYNFDEKSYNYLPIAIAICAEARYHLLKTAQKVGFENVQYMDTDSIKYINKGLDKDIIFDNDILGAWKNEGEPLYFKTISPKKYCYYENEILNFTCAGFSKKTLSDNLNHNKKVNNTDALNFINKFESGLSLPCLQSKKVNGGRILKEIEKIIT